MKDLNYLISIPLNDNKINLISELKAAILKSYLIKDPSQAIHQIDLPEFKLQKFDDQITSTTQKYLESSTNTLTINEQSAKAYLNNFVWNNYKYKRLNLDEIIQSILKNINKVDQDFKVAQQNYQIAKGTLNQLQRKQMGNLSTKSLAQIVSEENVTNSDFLETIFVAIPINNIKEWFNNYERLSKMVVPRSSFEITKDSEFVLVNVSVFRKYKHDFIQACRENKYIVREFQFDSSLAQKSSQELQQATEIEKQEFKNFSHTLSNSFSEAYQALAHIKFLRLFVESVLRYGLPTDYLYIVINLDDEKSSTKLLPALIQHYAHLSPSLANKANDKSNDISIGGEFAGLLDQDVYPFPLFTLESPRD
ncbi:ATPase, V1 complex, subunit C [Wallemia mellicola]|uniref:V-type proton ATPase subunit C n=1 Tax=Wallemia mellicola TaxID=1708541 RepID=A0A4T0RVB0_9BASI|nr:hypothetical protein E3Q24_02525 [Wallemia mellicola]TIB78612.1 ATPase, V1 complex, subunit C [Wallemia mellicola]TIB79292.1 hypothetical protein E3Q23_00304 [Wallemia mellicola]TIB87393.1 ATPase, V1 complex, subunit C [Wallemia mellicola]TIB90343.1 ATPase, V1 complex, subunit C [Wallemia mellicola]